MLFFLLNTMQKPRKDLFSDKFKLLNSQELDEDIKWSSSDSSDIENNSRIGKSFNVSNSVKRRRKRKKTGPKNISNLSITISDTSKNHNNVSSVQISPKRPRKNESKVKSNSPTFALPQTNLPHQKIFKVQSSSPILSCKLPQSKVLEKSPILHFKNSSPKASPKIRKNLFLATAVAPSNSDTVLKSVLNEKQSELHLTSHTCRKETVVTVNSQIQNLFRKSKDYLQRHEKRGELPFPTSSHMEEASNIENFNLEVPESQEATPNMSQQSCNEASLLKTTNKEKLPLGLKRDKSYFENHFSSGNTTQTQHSISDCPTQANFSKSSDDVEIISIVTQVNSKKGSFQSDQVASKNPTPISSQSAEIDTEKLKKIRYKKNGLAYRLNALLKKQNANISLWQHERYLADNSSFIIPKGEHLVFLIQRVVMKFGCYLLECIDVNDSNFLILISSIYVQESSISQNMILKLYEPFRILDYVENCKIILNVCKFECEYLSN